MPKVTSHVERLKSGLYGNYSEITDGITGFADMSVSEASKALRGAVSLAVNNIAQIAGKNLREKVKGSDNTLPEGGTLYQGIRVFVYKDKATGVVHVLGNKNSNDGTWRLRFFEGGTQDRYNKKKAGLTKSGRQKYIKGRYTGKIAPTWFFRDAIYEGEPQTAEIMMKHLETKIKDLAA